MESFHVIESFFEFLLEQKLVRRLEKAVEILILQGKNISKGISEKYLICHPFYQLHIIKFIINFI